MLVLSGRAGPGSADRLRELLVARARQAARSTVDVSGLAAADPVVVRVLVVAARLLRQRAGWLVLLGPQPEVARLLRADGAGTVMVIRPGKPAGPQGMPPRRIAGGGTGMPASSPVVS